MGRSAGTGSPQFFMCAALRARFYKDRDRYYQDHAKVQVTGRTKRHYTGQCSALGQRSSRISREYRCECGHVGWSNHRDLGALRYQLDPDKPAV